LPQGAARFPNTGTEPGATALSLRVGTAGAGSHSVTFTTRRDGPVSLSIFDAAGRRIAFVALPYISAGTHTLTWDGHNARGRPAPSGLYFARLTTAEGSLSTKL